MKVLVTGGAGFVGSHIVDELLRQGHEATVIDNLEYQVHNGKVPEYLNQEANYIFSDIGDEDTLGRVLDGIEVIFHKAAAVGVGQSMYQIGKYVSSNVLGTAKLLDFLVREEHDVKKLLVASSMSIYGEGKYECQECGVIYPRLREETQLRERKWEMTCPTCGKEVNPLPTDESKPLHPTSVYAVTKRDQEEMCLVTGKAYGIPTVALRYFNIYGPRQALSNPYTGVCAIFSCRLKNDSPPVIFEDGKQSRDFISVQDIVQANLLCLEKSRANYRALNVGTGKSTNVSELAKILAKQYEKDISPTFPNKYREGDIRHCYADISEIQTELSH